MAKMTNALIFLSLITIAIAFKLQKREDLDEELRRKFPNLPKKFFTTPQDVNQIDKNEILLDSYHPLTDADFERAKMLTEKDLEPTVEEENLLYSPDLFEGDIFGPLVSFIVTFPANSCHNILHFTERKKCHHRHECNLAGR